MLNKNTKTNRLPDYESVLKTANSLGLTINLQDTTTVHLKDNDKILFSQLSTPIGLMIICATAKGICLMEFTDRKMLLNELNSLQELLKSEFIIGENHHMVQAKKEINEYFLGIRQNFEVNVHTPGTEFQNQVWNQLMKIKFGKTSTYKNLAENINRPDSFRAVGTANGSNRIAIIIPCHRIIGKGGKLIGYSGGIERKKWLLNFESDHDNTRMRLF